MVGSDDFNFSSDQLPAIFVYVCLSNRIALIIPGTLWRVTYAKEREVEIEAENINEVYEEAKFGLRSGERVVSIRIKR